MVLPSVGTCYEDAWRFLIKEEEGELIHGTVESLGRRIGHAWVELPTSFIWEPESRRFIKKADFEAMAKPQEETRYSATEAAIMLTRVGKHGPWTEQERQLWLKRGNPAESRLEPWQMPKEKFVEIYLERFKRMLSKEAFARVTREELQKEREEAVDYHKHTIRQALKAGRPVPPEVLRDYPDMPRFPEAVPEVKDWGLMGRAYQEEFDKRFFQKVVEDLSGKSTDEIASYYAKIIMEERTRHYLQEVIARYNLPDDFLKLHQKIIGLAKPPAVGGNPDNTWTCPQCGRLNQIYPYPTRCSHCGYLRKVEKDNFRANLTPMSPELGPPLPQVLGIRWPWRKNSDRA